MFLNRYQLRSDYAFEACTLSRQITPSISAKKEKAFWFDILFGKAHNKRINVSVYRIKLHACRNHSALEINGK